MSRPINLAERVGEGAFYVNGTDLLEKNANKLICSYLYQTICDITYNRTIINLYAKLIRELKQ